MSERRNQHGIGYEPFEHHARRYDAWFDHERGRRIFPVEVACLRKLLYDLPRPWLEVGVGTGRFASALDIEEGIDPSKAVLKYARQRGIRVRPGLAEKLPYADCTFGAMFMIVTVCFLSAPQKAFRECARVLTPDGSLIIGLVPNDSPWGRMYAKKGKEGHPFYSVTTFYTCRDVIEMVGSQRFLLKEACSCLFESPDTHVDKLSPPRSGIIDNAGFVAMRFELQG